jgi:hypothetical protein
MQFPFLPFLIFTKTQNSGKIHNVLDMSSAKIPVLLSSHYSRPTVFSFEIFPAIFSPFPRCTPLLLLQLILLPLAPMCKEGFKIKDAQKEKE